MKIELLAPGGDIDAVKAAIAAGADAVYCGLNKFNARNRAVNISFSDLNGIVRLAHENDCQVFITLNIIVVESEIPDLIRLLNKLVNTSIDGVIVQDLGLFFLLSTHFPGLSVHASTQLTTHNVGQLKFLRTLSATRANLSRELNLAEIKALTSAGHHINLLSEIFVHGSYCLSFSGICYMSSVHGGNSGNRGRCSQPCRDEYEITPEGNHYPLNLKDNSAYFDLKDIQNAGVDSIKIEGRVKKFPYVYTVVNAYRKQLQNLYNNSGKLEENSNLYKVFNRDFSNAFLKGNLHKDMFIDNPRNFAAIHLSRIKGDGSDASLERAKKEVFEESLAIEARVRSVIDGLSVEKVPLTLSFTGSSDFLLKVAVETPDQQFEVHSEVKLQRNNSRNLDKATLLEKFKSLNSSAYFIQSLILEDMEENLFLPFKELTSIKNRIYFQLKNTSEVVDPVKLPGLPGHFEGKITPSLSVLIDSPDDLYLSRQSHSQVYYQLPDSLNPVLSGFIDLFRNNRTIIPWFPSILIGESYDAAVELLLQAQPEVIVTNNTGIAYESGKLGIPWIAGPFLNIANSYSLLCLKEKFGCTGSFISNELSQKQIKGIKRPDDFKLFYSIYHPLELMTSRQCLFQQVTGCHKERMDDACLQACSKSAAITNSKKVSFSINKTRGNYNRIYNFSYLLNLEVVADIPDLFSSYFVDLREPMIQTGMKAPKRELINLFNAFLLGHSDAAEQIRQVLPPTTNSQYVKGI